MRILILGGTGAMGKHLVTILTTMGHEVYVTTRSSKNKADDNQGAVKKVTYIIGDAHDNLFIKKLLNEQWNVIVDFMAYTEEEFKQKMMLLLKNTEQYIFLSSARVYADSDEAITESSARLLDICQDENYLATDEYALSKARQENLLRASGYENWTIVRPYITYADERLQLGVFEKENWLYRALHKRTIVFSKDIAEHLTTMTHGQDVANGISKLIDNVKALKQTVHIVNTQNMQWKDVLEIYLKVIKKCTGVIPKVYMVDNMNLIEKAMNNHYQIHLDRLYNRTFNNEKMDEICGENMKYTSMENGLELCLTNFIKNSRDFRDISWKVEACLDRITGENTPIKEIPTNKQRLKYLVTRYIPFNLLLWICKLYNHARI